jgi:hypothetical protein
MDVSRCFIIVIAGNETTRNGTSGDAAFISLSKAAQAAGRPSLLVPAVEEVVR